MTNGHHDAYYESAVLRIGEEAADMVNGGIWILYADPIPEALESVSIVHAPAGSPGREMGVGDRLWLDDTFVELSAIGERANENLRALGHVVVYLDPGDTQLLPGAVHAKGSLPMPSVGDRIALGAS